MSNIKVTYFNGRGLGELTRILLKYSNTEFEDIRIERENWPEVKPTTPFGVVPLYEENGKVMWQSLSIARYLARKAKLAGDNEWESFEIDVIADTVTDLRLKAVPWFSAPNDAEKAKIKETLLTETVPYFLERFEKIAGQNNGYLAAKKFSWADIYFFTLVGLFELLFKEDIVAKYDNLKKLVKTVSEVPAIKAWIESRPPSEF